MHVMTRRCSAMLGGLVLGFIGATMTGACAAPGESGCPAADVTPPDTDTATECPAPVEEPCMRYRIPLDGNPSTDMALRDKYIAAFGTACYMSEATTFDCFYKTWKAACADAVKIAEVYGAAPQGNSQRAPLAVSTTNTVSNRMMMSRNSEWFFT